MALKTLLAFKLYAHIDFVNFTAENVYKLCLLFFYKLCLLSLLAPF